jgi:hypothetical protein
MVHIPFNPIYTRASGDQPNPLRNLGQKIGAKSKKFAKILKNLRIWPKRGKFLKIYYKIISAT